MRITDLPVAERPRERLSALGVAHLSDRELLAIVLGTGTRGTGAHLLAEHLLVAYGSILDLARAHHTDLAAIPGMGLAKSCAVAALFELARRLPKSRPGLIWNGRGHCTPLRCATGYAGTVPTASSDSHPKGPNPKPRQQRERQHTSLPKLAFTQSMPEGNNDDVGRRDRCGPPAHLPVSPPE
jgi:hypothetical protein